MKKILVPLLVAAFLTPAVPAALAQSAPIRMGQPSTTYPVMTQTEDVLARQTARMGVLEQQLSDLTGRIENLEFQLRQSQTARDDAMQDNRMLTDKLAKLEAKVDDLSRRTVLPEQGMYSRPLPSNQPIPDQRPQGQATGTWSGSQQGQPSGPQDLRGAPYETPNSGNRVTSVYTGRPTDGMPPSNNTPSGEDLSSGSLGTISATRLPGGAGELFQLGRNRLLSFDYVGAEQAFRAFLDEFGDDPQAGEAYYWLGEALYNQGDFAGSARFFTTMLQEYPDDPLRGEGLVKLARSLREVGETKKACAFLSRMNDVAPDASKATRQRALQEQQRSGCS